jgi:two-component system, sensor histidine kinase
MRRARDLPIGTRLTLTLLVVSGIALATASAGFIAYDRVSTGEAMVRRLSGEAEIVGFNAASAVLFRDPDSAAITLGALRADLPVVSSAIYTAEGALFATYLRDAAVPRPAERLTGVAPPAGHAIEDGRLVVHQPIVFEGTRLGTLVIRCDLSEREQRLRRYLVIAAAVFVGALAVGLLGALGLARAITRPLLQLAEVARGVEERGDFTRRAPVLDRGDELGLLVSAFNSMLSGLQHRDQQLRDAQAELERRLEERTELYRQAEEANRLKDEFLATLSHELRTPLNAIVGWTALLRQGGLEPELQERAVATIDRNTRAQVKLVEDVLDVSRIISGKLTLKVQVVDLRALAGQAIDSVSHAAAARQIQLLLDAPPDLPPVNGDPDRLQQVMWNLLSNAIKFTPPGGHVTMTLSAARGQVEMEVRDDGAGIDHEFLPHVFERFRQADASSTRTHGGLGLGLAIVRHLTEMHGGTVRAESPGPGQGAAFTVSLPAAARDSGS